MYMTEASTLTELPRVRDIMCTDVVRVKSGTPLAEVARLLIELRISGAPVVDGDGRLVGIVSLFDLARSLAPASGQDGRRLLEREGAETYLLGFYQDDEAGGGTVDEVMTRAVLTVDEDALLAELVRRMLEARVHRIMVTSKTGDRLIGIVSTMDVLSVCPQLLSLAAASL